MNMYECVHVFYDGRTLTSWSESSGGLGRTGRGWVVSILGQVLLGIVLACNQHSHTDMYVSM